MHRPNILDQNHIILTNTGTIFAILSYYYYYYGFLLLGYDQIADHLGYLDVFYLDYSWKKNREKDKFGKGAFYKFS